LHQGDPIALGRVAFVLLHTSHPGNVGSAARAMKTMGLADLRLVAPRYPDVCTHDEARAFASGATDRLDAARVYPSLSDALADCALAVAVSAEAREFGPVPQTPPQAVGVALDVLQAHPDHRVAFVFGPERTGLSIEAVRACAAVLSIPASPVYSSLNLAQALQVVAYVLRSVALERDAHLPPPVVSHAGATDAHADHRLADQQAVLGLLEHLERAATVVGFLDPAHPRKLMPRLARLLQRARLNIEEVDLLRGLCKAMEQPRQRGGSTRAGGDHG
jgi:tRNA/rRNA methyltransferase